MQLDLANPSHLMIGLGPDLVLLVGTMLLLLVAAWRRETAAHQRAVGFASLLLVVLVIAAIVFYMSRGLTARTGPIAIDDFRWLSDLVFLIGAFATIALAMDYNAREGIHAAESHVLVLFAVSGMMLMAAGRDLIIIFLGLEIMSVASYVLAGLNRRSARSAEGALKYFLLGAFSTAFLLYGIALVYGATGTTDLLLIRDHITRFGLTESVVLLLGIALLLVGFAFKVAAAPFHMWAPDVYEGAPTPITAFMAASVKAAAFAAFLRVWLEAFPEVVGHWHTAVFWLAALTMVAGNAVALAQRNVKRLLAYSSIAHAGYLLVALAAATPQGTEAFLFYLLAYTLATFGAFAVVVALGSFGEADLRVEQYAGLWTVRPGMAVAMTIFMLALLGFPVFGGIGFFAKWYVLQAALQAPRPQTWLAILLVLTSVVSAGYYLYVVMVMFMRPRPDGAPVPARAGALTRFLIGATAALIIAFGLFPDPVVRLAMRGTPDVVRGAPRARVASSPTR
jgi:NADH-quinone oxidoreductase subunit N